MALLGVMIASVSLTVFSSANHSATIPRIPAGSLVLSLSWLPAVDRRRRESPPPSQIDVIDPETNGVDHYSLGGSGGIDYPFVVEGDVVVAIEDRPPGNGNLLEGTAKAFMPSQPATPAWSLGSASDVIPSVNPGEVWIATTPSGGPDSGCTIREETTSGRSLTPTYPLDCRRWIIAAVNGGFLSVPNVPSNDRPAYQGRPGQLVRLSDFTLQVWDPYEGTVVRTVSRHASFVLQASNRYVEWQDVSELSEPPLGSDNGRGGQGAVLNDIQTKCPQRSGRQRGAVPGTSRSVRRIHGIIPKGSEGTRAVCDVDSPVCVGPVKSAQGLVIVEDFETGAIVLRPDAPVSSEWCGIYSRRQLSGHHDRPRACGVRPGVVPLRPGNHHDTPQANMYSDAEDLIA